MTRSIIAGTIAGTTAARLFAWMYRAKLSLPDERIDSIVLNLQRRHRSCVEGGKEREGSEEEKERVHVVTVLAGARDA